MFFALSPPTEMAKECYVICNNFGADYNKIKDIYMLDRSRSIKFDDPKESSPTALPVAIILKVKCLNSCDPPLKYQQTLRHI
jgi:hypothetical protein